MNDLPPGIHLMADAGAGHAADILAYPGVTVIAAGPRWSAKDWAPFATGYVKLRYTHDPADYDAPILDVERAYAQPWQVPGWLDGRRARGHLKSRVYASLLTIDAVRHYAASRPFTWWAAHQNGTPHLYPGSEATQWFGSSPRASGYGTYRGVDLSWVTDAFLSDTAAPIPQTAMQPQSPPIPPGLGEQIAATAKHYLGHCYRWAGVPGADARGCWDCSSFCNYVIGAANGLAIPGFRAGDYNGQVHGPSSLGWLEWQGQGVGSIHRDLVTAGDIACWRTHMGIAIDNDRMVSAQNPADGTRESGIDGFIPNETLICLRLAVIGKGGVTFPIPTLGGTQAIDHVTMEIARSSVKLINRRMAVRTIGVRIP